MGTDLNSSRSEFIPVSCDHPLTRKVPNGRPPEPVEPCRNREISRLPKLRALENFVAFSYYSNLSLMRAIEQV